MDEREFEGYWWRPSDPDNKVPGRLLFSQAGENQLVLLGSFDGLKPGPFGQLDDEPRLHGVTKDRKIVTLDRCLGLGQAYNHPGFPVTTYRPHTLLVGAWYNSEEEVRFDEVYIRLTELDTWAVASGFGHEMYFDESRKDVTKLDVSYTPPPPIEIPVDGETLLSIAWAWTWSGLQEVTTETRLGQAASFKLAFAGGETMERCLEYVFRLRNFLSLAVGRPIRILSVTGVDVPAADAEPDPFTKAPPQRQSIDVLYRLAGDHDEPKRQLRLDEMLFTLADALPRLEEIFKAWFEHHDVLGPVFNRYFYIVHNRYMAREIQFESYVRALETYHRRKTRATDIPTEEHEARIAEILDSVPTGHRGWLENKLAYGNEPSLSRRLKETLGRCPMVTARAIGGSRGEQKGFVRKVVQTRNYEVHLDPDNEQDAATGLEIVVLAYQLRILIESVLLLDLGFSDEDLEVIFDRVRRFEQVDHLKRAAEEERTAERLDVAND